MIPPTLELLFAERFPQAKTWRGLRRRFLSFLKAVRQQAEWTFQNFQYANSTNSDIVSQFLISPSGPLNPISPFTACAMLPCRLDTADKFARTLGLYADAIFISDSVTDRVFLNDEWTDWELMQLMTDIIVLQHLKPLLDSGLLQFTSPLLFFCRRHLKDFERKIAEQSRKIVREIEPRIVVRGDADRLWLEVNEFDPAGAVEIVPGKKAIPRDKSSRKSVALKSYRDRVAQELRELMFTLHSSQQTRTLLLSSARLDTIALRLMEGRKIDVARIEEWEALRSVTLPWVNDLSVAEVVHLRESAPSSVAQLREFLVSSVTKSDRDSDAKARSVARDLRGLATEIEADLQNLRSTSRHKFNLGYGSLGLTIALYALAAAPAASVEVALTATTALLTILGFIHESEDDASRRRAELMTRPAYALLKAKEIVGHRH